jgi:RNA polymerase sigma factor (sigma-70 family)
MRSSYPVIRNLTETDDVVQISSMLLDKSLKKSVPDTIRYFKNVVALLVRRALQDLNRRYRGRNGKKARELTNQEGEDNAGPLDALPSRTEQDTSTEFWTRFHECVRKLPNDEKEVVELIWYGGAQQKEVATELAITLDKVRSLWNSAKLKLGRCLSGLCGE